VRLLFDRLAAAIDAHARPGEVLAATLEGESSDFVRLNGARLRQAGRVERAVARLRLVRDGRQSFHRLTLPGLDAAADAVSRAVGEAVLGLRAAIADGAVDPLLDLNGVAVVDDDTGPDTPFDRAAFVDAVAAAAGDADLVGFCAAGPVARGFCSSIGSRLWHARTSVSFDWSIHLPHDASAEGARKAVKAGWSGPGLDVEARSGAIARSRAEAPASIARCSRRARSASCSRCSAGGDSLRVRIAPGNHPLRGCSAARRRSRRSCPSPRISTLASPRASSRTVIRGRAGCR
jgi:predicted Zn-dependent protease